MFPRGFPMFDVHQLHQSTVQILEFPSGHFAQDLERVLSSMLTINFMPAEFQKPLAKPHPIPTEFYLRTLYMYDLYMIYI